MRGRLRDGDHLRWRASQPHLQEATRDPSDVPAVFAWMAVQRRLYHRLGWQVIKWLYAATKGSNPRPAYYSPHPCCSPVCGLRTYPMSGQIARMAGRGPSQSNAPSAPTAPTAAHGICPMTATHQPARPTRCAVRVTRRAPALSAALHRPLRRVHRRHLDGCATTAATFWAARRTALARTAGLEVCQRCAPSAPIAPIAAHDTWTTAAQKTVRPTRCAVRATRAAPAQSAALHRPLRRLHRLRCRPSLSMTSSGPSAKPQTRRRAWR